MTRRPDDTKRGYWREYRLGPLTEAAHVVGSTLIAVAVGLAVSFAVVMLIGLAGEQGLVPELSEVVDQVARASMGWLMALAYGGGLLFVLADSLRSVGVSRALARAAGDGADPMAVPHPTQVERVVLPPHFLLVWFLALTAAFAAMCLGVAWVDDHPTALRVSVVVTAGSLAAIAALLTLSRPAHRRRQRRIAEHWTAHAEQTAWGSARRGTGDRGSSPPDDGPLLGRGVLLLVYGAVAGILGMALLEVFLFVQYPGTVAQPGGTVQERGEYSDAGQAVLDGAVWVVVALCLAGLALGAAGAVVLARADAEQRAELSRDLDSPTSSRPERAVLARYAERRTSALGQLAAGFGAFVLVPSLAVLVLATHESETFLDSVELFAGVRTHALVGVVVAVALLVVGLGANTVANLRGYALRDRLQQRWPTLPKKPDDKKSRRYGPRTKPTLRLDL